MNVLEKILEEIERAKESIIDMSDEEPEMCDVEDWLEEGEKDGKMKAYLEIEKIIRSHMNEGKDLNVPTNNWIPVSDRLPEDGTYICTLDGKLIGEEELFTGMCGIENGKWDEEGCVIAWQPLPEPYKGDCDEKRKI